MKGVGVGGMQKEREFKGQNPYTCGLEDKMSYSIPVCECSWG